jgi:membrane protein required for colicin V production
MEFTVVDAGVAVIVLISGILAYSRGFTRELFAIAGWIVAAIVAFFATPLLEPLIREVPGVGPFLARSCMVSVIAAFTIIVALVLLVLSVFTPLIAGLVLDSVLGPLDRILGFVFGVVRGLLLIAIAFLIYTNLSGVQAWAPLDKAASRAIFEESSTLLQQNLPDRVPAWLGARIDALMVSCSNRTPAATSPTEGNVGAGGGAGGTGATGTTSTTGGADTGTTGTTGN